MHLSPIYLTCCLSWTRLGQVKSGAVKLYKRRSPNEANIYQTSGQLFIIFKIATIAGDVTEQITSEVDLLKSIMQQNVIENEFKLEYAQQATIQTGMAIEFTDKLKMTFT